MDRRYKMAKKKRVSKKKILRFILIICFFIIVIWGMCAVFSKVTGQKKVKQEVKVEEKIEEYGYELDDNETSYYKSLFQNLKSILSEEVVEEEQYASVISQLFLADFFNLDNKLSKNDIGGLQFVYSDFQNDFEKLAKESVYRYVKNNIYGDRNQELPIVAEVTVLNVDSVSFTYLDQEDKNAYQVDLKIAYKEDMGYQENATLILVHHNDRLEIIKMTE